MLLVRQGRVAEAITNLEQAVAIDEAIQHPDLPSHRAALERLRRMQRMIGRWLPFALFILMTAGGGFLLCPR